jgi:plastocyanin
MAVRDIYLKIETIPGYSPVEPDDHATPPIQYGRDCMRNQGHEDGTVPPDEVGARRLTALIYREYLDHQYLVPKPDKLVAADVNEPAFARRVPGTVIYACPGDLLRIHVKNSDTAPHSFHVHGLRYGIDSDGSWPFGTQSDDGRRSDEICPGQTWTYTYGVTEEMKGAWPFHDHYRSIGASVNRGLFGGIVVMDEDHYERLPRFPFPHGFEERLQQALRHVQSDMGDQPAAASSTPGMAMGSMPMPGSMPRQGHGMDFGDLPAEIVPYVVTLDELAHAPQPIPDRDHVLHVPLFLHQMSGTRSTPVFQSAPLNPGASFTSSPFTLPATYNYICGIHGAIMSGSVTVAPGGPSTQQVTIADFSFTPANVTVGVGGTVTWVNNGPSQHSVVELGGGDNLPSYCFNGRSFVGNTPTIVAHAGQRIRWYVFDLDLGMTWHNFHPHAQRWRFANDTIDVRSIGPAESFVLETAAPPVLLLSPDLERAQDPDHRPHDATEHHLRGDFLVHCHVEMHMMQGLVALVRSQQTVWLTPAQAHQLSTTIGLAIDPGGNACPAVQLDRCATAIGGRWDELPGLPEITFMHAVLLANSSRLLFWGYGPRADQSRLWDQSTGLYTQPANQPAAVWPDQNIWSGAHAHLDDAVGTVLIHGGFYFDTAPPKTPDTERRAFLFDPATSTWSQAANLHTGRFYPTTVTLADGTALTLFGEDHANAAGTGVTSSENFTPGGGAGAWSAPAPVPFNYFYYPWTFQLPGGDLFIAGPQKPARRFDLANPAGARQYNQISSQRGVNMDGTAVLLPLRPPHYEPRVLVAGGSPADATQTAEWIDLSVATPAWQALPNLNVARDKVNSVLLPDGRVMIAGGVETLPDGGPAELFDPEDPASGFQLGPNMRHIRGYHSAAILMPDGSVVMGGDAHGGRDGGGVPNERYLPSYFFKPRPVISGSPATISHGTPFSVQTPAPAAIAEVVLMRPGAVTHGFNQSQRYIGCAITGTSATAVQATAPPDGTVAPPGHYLLFLVDRDRAPSTGTWIRLT